MGRGHPIQMNKKDPRRLEWDQPIRMHPEKNLGTQLKSYLV